MAAQPSSADGPAVLRFHERCGAAVMVTDDGMTVEKKEKIEQADNEGGQQPWKYWKYVTYTVAIAVSFTL